MKIRSFLLVSLFFLFAGMKSIAQVRGDFFYRNFTANDLKASDWIQSITQDNRGIIYAGNNLGTVLEYDGSLWRIIPATNGPIRALKADTRGRIYVGSFGDFGYLEPSGNGEMKYHSLMDKVNDDDKDISDVWSIEIFNEDVYFRSVERLFRYRNGKITAFKNTFGWFGNLIQHQGELYVTIDYKGIILKVREDSLVKFFESGEFASMAFGASAPYSQSRRIIGSWGGGIFLFCPENINKPGRKVLERINTPVARANLNLLKGVEVYLVKPGIFASRTDEGITVFDKSGREIIYFDSGNGLKSSLVETVFSDKDQVLWIGTEKGITRTDISSPFTSWYSISESTGTVWGVISHMNQIYFWGVNGIFRLKNNSFEKIHPQTYGLVKFPEPERPSVTHLLAINYNSLVEVKNNQLIKLLSFPEPLLYQQIFVSKRHSNRIYLYGANGLHLIRFNEGKWIWEGNIARVTTGIQSFSEDENGDLWLAISNSRRLVRLMPETDDDDPDKVPVYLKQLYSPSPEVASTWIRCFTIQDRTVFGSDKGLFRYQSNTNRFVHDSILGKRFTDGLHAVYILREGSNGSVFIADRVHRQDDIGMSVPQPDGSYKWYSRPFLGLTSHIRIYDACFDESGSVWLATDEGINKYDPLKDKKTPSKFHTLIREVLSGKDSALFKGTYVTQFIGQDQETEHAIPAIYQPYTMIPELPDKMNSMVFRYSAVSFEGEEQNEYKYRLEGFDKEWSKWTSANYKEYSNLPAGDYIFRVRGRNLYGIESDDAVYRFSILPPWYKTILAYFFYAILAGLIIYGIIIYNLRRLTAANLKLEASVRERTTELQVTLGSLEETNAIKDKLFAVIGHDLKNSLSALISISGVLSRHHELMSEEDTAEGIVKIEHAALEMDKLLEHLLEWTRIQNGNVKFNPSRFNLRSLTMEMISIMHTAAEKKSISINQGISEESWLNADRHMVGTVLRNMLNNAIKFSPMGGVINIIGSPDGQVKGYHMYNIQIQDSGVGMTPEQIASLFRTGRTISTPGTANEKGTGLGLLICKDLVEINGGTISVTSTPGKGSTFSFSVRAG